MPTFDSLNPATGEVLATFPIDTADDVRAAVGQARTAAQWWREIGFDGRRQRLHAWRRVLVAGLTNSPTSCIARTASQSTTPSVRWRSPSSTSAGPLGTPSPGAAAAGRCGPGC